MGFIGITERGDAGIDMRWRQALDENVSIQGAILITKKVTDEIIRNIQASSKPCLVHVTCTGWGQTAIEPGAPRWQDQIQRIYELHDKNIPFVVRIDPIIPTTEGIKRAENILAFLHTAARRGDFPDLPSGLPRIRISIIDMYPHVRGRFAEAGIEDPYHGNFSPSPEQIKQLIHTLERYGFSFETCAEPLLIQTAQEMGISCFEPIGCISMRDYTALNLPAPDVTALNGQNRRGCLCLQTKKELFQARPAGGCPLKCKYCYWK